MVIVKVVTIFLANKKLAFSFLLKEKKHLAGIIIMPPVAGDIVVEVGIVIGVVIEVVHI